MNTETTADDLATLQNPVVLFDGVCNLCQGSVQFLIRHDPHATLRFASLQSPTGQRLLARGNLRADYLDSLVLVDKDGCHIGSEAALRIGGHLGGIASLGSALLFVPRPVRDRIYKLLANNRYRFGKKPEECWLPTPELRARFLP